MVQIEVTTYSAIILDVAFGVHGRKANESQMLTILNRKVLPPQVLPDLSSKTNVQDDDP
ncbi:MAG: hypothetical protein ABFQ95_03235 [Pseudomonadota bacterium]